MKKTMKYSIIAVIVVITVLGCGDDGVSTQTGARADKFLDKLFIEVNPLILEEGWAWVNNEGNGNGGYIFYDNGECAQITMSGGNWSIIIKEAWFTDGTEITIGPNTYRYEIKGDILTLRHITNTNLVITLKKTGGINIS
jgi:hypothetical protein